MLTMVNTIMSERRSITMPRTEAHAAGNRSRVPVPTQSGHSCCLTASGARAACQPGQRGFYGSQSKTLRCHASYPQASLTKIVRGVVDHRGVHQSKRRACHLLIADATPVGAGGVHGNYTVGEAA